MTCSCCSFFFLRNGIREKRSGGGGGGGGGQGENVWSDNVHIQLRIIIKLPVNPNITLFFYLYRGLEAQAKPQAS